VRNYLVRFGFGATASVVAGIVTLLHGPVAGGVFLAFPAILPATLTLLEKDKGTVAAVADARGAVIGALSLIAFAATVIALHGRLWTVAALAAALGAWGVASMLLYAAGTTAARLLGAERYPPEVPVSIAAPLVAELRTQSASIAIVDVAAGGALAAVLAEVEDAADVLLGAAVAADTTRAGTLLDLDDTAGLGPSSELAMRLASAARARWPVTLGLALVGTAGAKPAESETFYVALATSTGGASKTFTADRGGQGNWGHAVLVALAFVREALRAQGIGATHPAVPGTSPSARGSAPAVVTTGADRCVRREPAAGPGPPKRRWPR
jgi:nicotinamide mononucleotide (NMN) deamidase PncC